MCGEKILLVDGVVKTLRCLHYCPPDPLPAGYIFNHFDVPDYTYLITIGICTPK